MTDHENSGKGDATVKTEEVKEAAICQGNSSKLTTPSAVLLGSFVIAGALFFGLNNIGGTPADNGGNSPRAEVPTKELGQVEEIGLGDMPVLGDENAPVVIVEWSDYQCPFCVRFFSQTEPEIIKQYVNTGKVRFAYRDFAFLGKESQDASNAARCANEQGKFWEFHDLLFKSQNGENRGGFSKDNLKGLGADIGLNTSQFDSCVDSDKYADAVSADTAAGRAVGVSGTPATFINGRVVNGAQPFSEFQKIIEEELAALGE